VNFDLDSDQLSFAAAARDFFSAQGGQATARRMLDDQDALPAPGAKALADIGFLGITVPENCGGAGRGLLDLAVVAEQSGRYLCAPSLSTAARSAVLLQGCAPQLRALADGSTAFAVLDGSPSGSVPSLDAQWATAFLALDGDALVLGAADIAAGPHVDATRGLATATLTTSALLRHDAGALWATARNAALVVLAAEDLGAATQALEVSVDYVKLRQAFGRPVGSYQAIKHALVEVFSELEQLRSLVWWAAWAADNAPAELPLAAAAAAAHAARTFDLAAETAIQVHGGIGFTWEHDAHLYWRRAKVDRLVLGDEATHLDNAAKLALSGHLTSRTTR
jgi:alkylation response protein AidB-like acyl-CoA dehydrogenase